MVSVSNTKEIMNEEFPILLARSKNLYPRRTGWFNVQGAKMNEYYCNICGKYIDSESSEYGRTKHVLVALITHAYRHLSVQREDVEVRDTCRKISQRFGYDISPENLGRIEEKLELVDEGMTKEDIDSAFPIVK